MTERVDPRWMRLPRFVPQNRPMPDDENMPPLEYWAEGDIRRWLRIEAPALIPLIGTPGFPRAITKTHPRWKNRDVIAWVRKSLTRPEAREGRGTDVATIQSAHGLVEIPRLGHESGVYFLCREDRVVYIGQSGHVARRLASHHIDFERAFFVPVPADRLLDYEAALIHHFQPPGNRSECGRINAPILRYPIAEVLRELGLEP